MKAYFVLLNNEQMIKVCRTFISPYMTYVGLRNSVYRAKNIIFAILM